ncbi:MAG TPA: 16S rRNA (adenine(1518)-N(6)/adenine(1519)-N(6))-dimethyltransferase RsmA [Planctomycetota bacterium]
MSAATDPLGAQDGRRPGWSVFRAALAEAGFRPTKTLGQNFLVDPNAARSIALDAGLAAGARVLEIGAGCGFLTLHLAELGLEVLAVEIDARLFAVARRLLAAHERVRWLHLDALAGKHDLDPELCRSLPPSGEWHVVANLPYSISGPLLVLLARLPNPPRTLTVLVQEELARRVASEPGQAEWGALGARLRLGYRAALGRPVGAQLFWPRPRVASRVLRLERVPASEAVPDAADLDPLVEHLFQQRRKQVLPLLARALGGRAAAAELLARLGLDPTARPEDLPLAGLWALARSEAWRGRPRKDPLEA